MTLTSFSIHRKLVEEGFDTTSDSYYNEIDKRMKDTFPHRFDKVSPTQAVSSVNRTGGSRKAQRHSETHTITSCHFKKTRCATKRICEIREGVGI